jgi:3-methyladenine DNA glycosylase AlkD
MATKKATKTTPSKKPATTKPAATRMTLAETMAALEQAGSAQTKKTYLRHGAPEPVFGVSFATLGALVKRIKVDHELAMALWDTGNFDARNLAFKVVDPQRMEPSDLDRWAKTPTARMCHGYIAYLAAEGPHGETRANAWLDAPDEGLRCSGWMLAGALAMLNESMPDAWFKERLTKIEKTIHSAPNEEREAMNRAVISIGCRNDVLRKAAIAAAKKIGTVDIDYGDTSCKTPDAAAHIEKAWTHSSSKNYASPAAHERSREPMRIRC